MLSPQSWDSCQCSMLPLDIPCNCPWPFTHSCLLDGNYLCLKLPPNLWSIPYIMVRVSDFCKKPYLPKCHLPKVHSCIWFLFATTGFPDGSVGKESSCNAGDPSSIPGLGKIHWRRDRPPTPVFLGLPCGSAGKESACDTKALGSIPGWEDALEKGKATHSSILAWVTNSRTQLSDFHFLINLAMFPFIVFHHNLHYF